MSNTTKGSIAAVSYAFIIGFSFLISKIAIGQSSPIDLSAQRFLFAFLAFLPMMYRKRNVLRFQMKDLKILLPVGLLYPVLFFALQSFGLVYASSSEAGILNSVSPIIILVFSTLFLKEKIELQQILFTLVSVSGVLFILIMQGATIGTDHLWGLILLLLSGVSFALYNVIIRKYNHFYSVTQFSFASVAMGFLIFNGISITNHILHGNLLDYVKPLFHISYLLSILYLGILASLGSALLSSYALKKLPASKVGVFGNLATMISIIAGAILLGEKITIVHGVGVILILVGVIGANKAKLQP